MLDYQKPDDFPSQCSKLPLFWSPWRVEKIFGEQNYGDSKSGDGDHFTVKGRQKATF